jgi:tetratricopeptide (TPR) repeat protein
MVVAAMDVDKEVLLDTSPENDDDGDMLMEKEPVRIASKPLTALEWKELGNKLTALKKFPQALKAYDCALQTLEKEEPNSPLLTVPIWSNRALVLIKMRQFQAAEEASSKALEIDPTNVKGK